MQSSSNSDYIHYDGNCTCTDSDTGSNVCSLGTTTAFITITAGTYIDFLPLPRHEIKDLMRCLKEPREFDEFDCIETFFPPEYLRARVADLRCGLINGRMATGRTGRGAG